ncbi:MAG TPA: guanylate kinase [Bacilli bacterium]
MLDEGLLIVLSGPSGVGKGTVCAALRAATPQLVYSISATTRAPRSGEKDGVNYFFKTKEQFNDMIKRDELLEWAEYVGNFYGTPKSFVEQTIKSGKDVILEIDVQGAMKVKEKWPSCVCIFLAPPSLQELRQRIIGRGTESDAAIRHRMATAAEELQWMKQYDYVVINDQIALACQKIQAIVLAEHCKKERMFGKFAGLLHEVTRQKETSK